MAISAFQFELDSVFQAMELSSFERSLFLMVGAGQYGPFSQFWAHSFRELACLHLLVLSGSQVNGLAEVLRIIFGTLFRISSVERALWIYFFLISFVLIYYSSAVSWSPPITRASLFWIVSSIPFGIGSLGALCFAFILHCCFFPEHLSQASFFLSWISFLLIHLCSKASLSKFWTRVVGTSFCLLISQLIFFGNSIRLDYFLTGLLANLLLGIVFEHFIASIMSFIIAAVLLRTLIPFPFFLDGIFGILEFFLAPFFKAAVVILLVGLKALRYING